jgi:hypothetical protein
MLFIVVSMPNPTATVGFDEYCAKADRPMLTPISWRQLNRCWLSLRAWSVGKCRVAGEAKTIGETQSELHDEILVACS